MADAATIYVLARYFFFNDTATTEIYTLSLHDALPISPPFHHVFILGRTESGMEVRRDRKSTRLNSSHPSISYAVFCLKKKTLVDHGGSILYDATTYKDSCLLALRI